MYVLLVSHDVYIRHVRCMCYLYYIMFTLDIYDVCVTCITRCLH